MEAHAGKRIVIYKISSVFSELLVIIIALIATIQCHRTHMCNALSGEHTNVSTFTSAHVNTDADV